MSTQRPDEGGSSRARAPVTDAERAQIIELAEAGESRNAIARAVGRSGDTVSRIVADAGLSFDRSATAAASAARAADNAEKRSRLQALLLDDALALREQLWKPATVYNWSKDNDFDTQVLDRPDFAGQSAIMRTVSTAATTAAKLAEQDKQAQNPEEVASLLGALVDGLRDEYPEEGDDDGAVSPEAE